MKNQINDLKAKKEYEDQIAWQREVLREELSEINFGRDRNESAKFYRKRTAKPNVSNR